MSKEINSDQQKLLISVTEMAQRLNLSKANCYCVVHSADGPKTIRIGKRILVPLAELERWINEKMQKTGGTYK